MSTPEAPRPNPATLQLSAPTDYRPANPTAQADVSPAPAVSPFPAASRSCRQPALDRAIADYLSARSLIADLLEQTIDANDDPRSRTEAAQVFGRNEPARYFRVRSRAMVGKSPHWRTTARRLGLLPDPTRRRRGVRVSFDLADERAAEVRGDETAAEIERREVAELIRRSRLTPEYAAALLDGLADGTQTPRQVGQVLAMLAADYRPRADPA